jgi:phage shock protein E
MKIMLTRLLLLSSLLGFALPAAAEPIWIDVRTVEEYASDHIEGDVNVPLAALDTAALADAYGKDAELMLYCRSGNRAGQAQAILEAAGFSNVDNAGGIADVRQLRGIAEQSPAPPVDAPAR